ncbi:MAG: CDP-diacylglycerol--glycerol-3-phosphate 3-phosphatidyltransferase [Eubacteriales bacterium]|nr:CDP-diacylglycerol--glycerol-3-phosphate 3-phosphatidyltransferase [Eubacteriales bacterium]
MQRFCNYIKKNANVPNALTLLRLFCVPAYWYIYYNVNDVSLSTKYRFIIFLLASITDFLDGFIARKFNIITDFGKLADPVADKLMVVSVLLSQQMLGIIPIAPIVVLIVKESLLIIGSIFLLKKKIVVYSNIWGKLSTASFILSLFLTFFASLLQFRFDILFIWISVVLSLFALCTYVLRAIGFLNYKA